MNNDRIGTGIFLATFWTLGLAFAWTQAQSRSEDTASNITDQSIELEYSAEASGPTALR